MKDQPFTFAISSVSGGGKTTITHRLLERLCDSRALFFDEYDFEGEPGDICKWVEDGSDYRVWNLSLMIKDIETLKSKLEVKYIILDYPFGYLHTGMSKYIDYTIFIDTPLDIAMARRILRDYSEHSGKDIQKDVRNYLDRGRFAYLDMLQRIKPVSDLIIDGTLELEAIEDVIIKAIEERKRVL